MGLIVMPNGSPAMQDDDAGGNGHKDPSDKAWGMPAHVAAKLPKGHASFEITDEIRAGLTWQQNEAVYEEWFHRQAYVRMGYPCDRVLTHNFSPCPYCQGLGERVSPNGARSPCARCGGVGALEDIPPITWGCKHVYPQDEMHPDGLVFHPRRYYCCKKCLDLIERKRFKFSTEMVLRCYLCINEESYRLHKINPEFVVDLTVK